MFRYIYTLDTSDLKPIATDSADLKAVFVTHVHPTYETYLLAEKINLQDLASATREHLQWLIHVTLSKFGEFSKIQRLEWTSWILDLWKLDTANAILLKKEVLTTMSCLKLDVWHCSEIEDLMASNIDFACAMANVCKARAHQMLEAQSTLEFKVKKLEARVRMLEAEAEEQEESPPAPRGAVNKRGGKGR